MQFCANKALLQGVTYLAKAEKKTTFLWLPRLNAENQSLQVPFS